MNSGGLSPEEPATPEIKDFARQVKDKLEKAMRKRFAIYKTISYCSQVVAGMNYFVKVHSGDQEREYVHLKIFKALPCNEGVVVLIDYRLDKTRDDPIVPF